MKLIALAVVLGACGASQPNVASVAAAPPAHARVGCIDVVVETTERVPSPTLRYHIANTCDHEATVGLAELRTIMVDPDGNWQALSPERRQRESHPSYRIDAHDSEVAEVLYRGDGLAEGSQICVDLGHADDAVAYATRWTCVH
jgi:hypothetical protein